MGPKARDYRLQRGIFGYPLKRFTDEEVRLVAGVAPGVIEADIDMTFPCNPVSHTNSSSR